MTAAAARDLDVERRGFFASPWTQRKQVRGPVTVDDRNHGPDVPRESPTTVDCNNELKI
jgi:hypothetical protein